MYQLKKCIKNIAPQGCGSIIFCDFTVDTERQIKCNKRGIVSKGDENTAV